MYTWYTSPCSTLKSFAVQKGKRKICIKVIQKPSFRWTIWSLWRTLIINVTCLAYYRDFHVLCTKNDLPPKHRARHCTTLCHQFLKFIVVVNNLKWQLYQTGHDYSSCASGLVVGRGEEINIITTNTKKDSGWKLDEEGMCLAVQNMAESCWPEKKKRSARLNNSDFKEMNEHAKKRV